MTSPSSISGPLGRAVQGCPRFGACAAAVLAFSGLALPAFAEFDESHRFASRSLDVSSLIGKVDIAPAAGDEFEVDVAVRGADGAPENIRIDMRRGAQASLEIVFPTDEERHFVYPEFSRKKATLWFRDGKSSSLLGEILRAVSGRRIRVERDGRGMEVWADLTIRVPVGASLELDLGAGEFKLRVSRETWTLTFPQALPKPTGSRAGFSWASAAAV